MSAYYAFLSFYGEPSEGKEGIVGGVAKALVKELTGKQGEIVETELSVDDKRTIGEYELNKSDNENWYLKNITNGEEFRVPDKYMSEKGVNEYKKILNFENTSTQHSIEITPELRAAVEKGQPLFKEAEAQYRIEKAAFCLWCDGSTLDT